MGALDVQIAVQKDNAGNVVAEIELSKDGEAGLTLTSRLKVVEIGRDPEGDPITSCVVEPVDGESAAATVKREGKQGGARRLPKAARTALRALSKAIEECGEPAPASNTIPPSPKS